MKDALVLFSGGKDSFLSTLIMLDKGYNVHLITYDNGLELKSKNVLNGAKRIQKKYGNERVKIIGVKKTDAIWRELISDVFNFNFNYIIGNYGDITISQLNCLSCRLAMYLLSIIICRQNNIDLVIDGARKSQLFAIEQEKFLKIFKDLFNKYNLDINFPLADVSDDFYVKNQILARGFVPKMSECQCLVGMAIGDEGVNNDIVNGLINLYEKHFSAKIDLIINKYKDVIFDGDYL